MNSNYSETELERIRKTVNQWFDQFTDSPLFERLSHEEKSDSGAIVEFFSDYSYNYLGVPPEQWDLDSVLECCTRILPRKVSAEREFFARIAPVLSAFFSFLSEKSLIQNGADMADAVLGVADEIVERSQDQSTWGPAKQMVMAAHSAGVDIRDENQLNAFITGLNMRMAARMNSAEQPLWTSGPDLPRSRSLPFPPPADRYAPCPCGSSRKFKFCCEPLVRK